MLVLVERRGEARSFHISPASKAEVSRITRENTARESRFHTDESKLNLGSDAHFAAHERIRHSYGEYVPGDVHTNTAENVFSVFKRGMKGIYQHCAEKHLHCYLAEFDFRYNHRVALGVDDAMRADQMVKGIVGKRLTYQTTRQRV